MNFLEEAKQYLRPNKFYWQVELKRILEKITRKQVIEEVRNWGYAVVPMNEIDSHLHYEAEPPTYDNMYRGFHRFELKTAPAYIGSIQEVTMPPDNMPVEVRARMLVDIALGEMKQVWIEQLARKINDYESNKSRTFKSN